MKRFNIYKRKDGRFEGRIYASEHENGKRKYVSFYGKSQEEVKQKMINAGSCQQQTVYSSSMTIGELVNEWLFVMSARIKESTASNYRMKAKKHIIPTFGDMKCDDINSKIVYTFIEKKIKEGLSLRYVLDIIVLMKSIFKYASREYNIKNVLDGIIMPKKTKADIQLLNEREQDTLKKYIKNHLNNTTVAIAVSLYTGMRLGEICALKWGDIDLEKRVITVRRTVQRIQNFDGLSKTKLIITEPKSASSKREIPIPKCLMALLKIYKREDNLFVLSAQTKPIEPRTMQYRFAAILKNAKLPSVHFHSLRHCFATKCIACGFDVKTLSEILGHSSIELTLNRYVHSSFDRKKLYMDMLV